jgi:hypothetical protein
MDEEEVENRHEMKKNTNAEFGSIKNSLLKEFDYESFDIKGSNFNRSKFSKSKRLVEKQDMKVAGFLSEVKSTSVLEGRGGGT